MYTIRRLFFFFLCFVVPGIEFEAFCMLSLYSATELNAQLQLVLIRDHSELGKLQYTKCDLLPFEVYFSGFKYFFSTRVLPRRTWYILLIRQSLLAFPSHLSIFFFAALNNLPVLYTFQMSEGTPKLPGLAGMNLLRPSVAFFLLIACRTGGA